MGTGNTTPRADAFLGSIGSPNLTQRVSPSRLRHTSGGFTNQKPYTLRPGQFHCLARLPCCVTPVMRLTYQFRSHAHQTTAPEGATARLGWLVSPARHGRCSTGTGISTRYPSTTPVGLALGPD